MLTTNGNEELKQNLLEGKLVLDRSNDLDQKLLFLLETKHLQPYELIRLRNVYSFWESYNLSIEDLKSVKENTEANISKIKGKDKKQKQLSPVRNGKRPIENGPHDSEQSNVEATPSKRQQ
jgi:hypothetical protein